MLEVDLEEVVAVFVYVAAAVAAQGKGGQSFVVGSSFKVVQERKKERDRERELGSKHEMETVWLSSGARLTLWPQLFFSQSNSSLRREKKRREKVNSSRELAAVGTDLWRLRRATHR